MKEGNVFLMTVIIAVAVLLIPTILAAQNSISAIGGDNIGSISVSWPEQVTVNPNISDNVEYRVECTITTGGGTPGNLTSFHYNLPDNSTTHVITDFVFQNGTGYENATRFVNGSYNYVSFNLTKISQMNNTADGETFNITFKLDSPISWAQNISVSKSGRKYTEKFNITSSATNLTVVNASLIIVPSYWYTRVGAPLSVKFNNTAIDEYTYSYSSIIVYTDLNLSSNLEQYGSGWGELEIQYNGPTVDQSSGSSPQDQTPAPPEERTTTRAIFLLVSAILVIIILVVTLIVVLGKR